MGEDTWEGDEYGEELPVVPFADEVPKRKRRWRPVVLEERPGGVPFADVPEARRTAMADATGRGEGTPVNGWRNDLVGGQRGKAVSEIASKKPTHNSASGFGLA